MVGPCGTGAAVVAAAFGTGGRAAPAGRAPAGRPSVATAWFGGEVTAGTDAPASRLLPPCMGGAGVRSRPGLLANAGWAERSATPSATPGAVAWGASAPASRTAKSPAGGACGGAACWVGIAVSAATARSGIDVPALGGWPGTAAPAPLTRTPHASAEAPGQPALRPGPAARSAPTGRSCRVRPAGRAGRGGAQASNDSATGLACFLPCPGRRATPSVPRHGASPSSAHSSRSPACPSSAP